MNQERPGKVGEGTEEMSKSEEEEKVVEANLTNFKNLKQQEKYILKRSQTL